MRVIVMEAICCQRCGIELPEWDSTEPKSGSWEGAYLCRGCHLETTNMRVKKGVKPRSENVSIEAMTILERIGQPTARRTRLPAVAPAPGP